MRRRQATDIWLERRGEGKFRAKSRATRPRRLHSEERACLRIWQTAGGGGESGRRASRRHENGECVARRHHDQGPMYSKASFQTLSGIRGVDGAQAAGAGRARH